VDAALGAGLAPDVGQELDEIQVWEPAWTQGLAGFPAWQPGGSRDVAAAQDGSPVLLLGVAES